ncbi:MAG TPA: hypothetical protein PLV92_26575, partial [Pirellulaceae bacterium]|nr:hypothetical protein [Pirellulaceae bacterium]
MQTGAGVLTINSPTNIAVANQTGTIGGVNGASLSGTLALQVASGAATSRTMTLSDSAADIDLLVTAKITDGDGNANLQSLVVQPPASTLNGGRVELRPTVASDFTGTLTVAANVGAGGTSTLRVRAGNAGALGASGATAGTIVSGGTLELSSLTVVDEPLSLSGVNGFADRGGVVGLTGANVAWQQSTVANLVALTGDARIGVESGGTLDFNAQIAQSGGSRGFTKVLGGDLRLSGSSANTFAGTTNVWEGRLRLAKSAGVDALAGGQLNIGVGNDTGDSADRDALIEEAGEQINPSVTVQIGPSGVWDLGGFTESIGNTTNATALTIQPGLALRPTVMNGTL